MEILFILVLTLHIIGGFVALLTGSVNVLRKKGDKKHKTYGKLFFFAMLITGTTSLILSVLNPNHFLFMVGVFTLYMAWTGNRYIYLYMHNSLIAFRRIDRLVKYSMLIAGLLFIGFGVSTLLNTNLFGLVFITFGFFSLLFVRQDFINDKRKPNSKNYWLIAHLQRMTGAFIATLTAFLVVNANYLPEQIPGTFYWLLPTLIITPFIIKWSRKLEVKKL